MRTQERPDMITLYELVLRQAVMGHCKAQKAAWGLLKDVALANAVLAEEARAEAERQAAEAARQARARALSTAEMDIVGRELRSRGAVVQVSKGHVARVKG